jgi:hypothetical protein
VGASLAAEGQGSQGGGEVTKLIGGSILAVFLISPPPSRRLNDSQLHEVVWCIQQKGQDVGSPLPHFNEQTIRFRYHAGQYPFQFPEGEKMVVDRNDEMRIGIYGPNEHSLVIYNIFLEEKGSAIKVYLGFPASFSKHRNKWMAGDNPGGTTTELYLYRLLQDFSSQEPQVMDLMSLSTPPQNVSCQVMESAP